MEGKRANFGIPPFYLTTDIDGTKKSYIERREYRGLKHIVYVPNAKENIE